MDTWTLLPLSLTGIFLTSLVGCSTAGCPLDVVRGLFACFAHLQGPDANQLVVAGGDLDAVKERCNDGSFPRAVNCIKSLLHSCRHSSQLPLLEDITDTSRMEAAFIVFCNNVNLYAIHRQCLIEQDTPIQLCMVHHSKKFYHQPTARNNRMEEVSRLCTFFTNTTGCIDRPVRQFCDPNLADVLVRFMSGITPPVCKPYPEFRNAGSLPTKTAALRLVFSAIVVAVVW